MLTLLVIGNITRNLSLTPFKVHVFNYGFLNLLNSLYSLSVSWLLRHKTTWILPGLYSRWILVYILGGFSDRNWNFKRKRNGIIICILDTIFSLSCSSERIRCLCRMRNCSRETCVYTRGSIFYENKLWH